MCLHRHDQTNYHNNYFACVFRCNNGLSECHVNADIAFVIDNSGSIRDKNPDDSSYDNYELNFELN